METPAASIDQDQQWVLNCLSASLDPNRDVRSFAEASLSQASSQPGFGCVLAKIAANKHLSIVLLHYFKLCPRVPVASTSFVSGVLLKQYIKKHWQEGEDSFEYPAISEQEKEVIREFLLLSLDDNHRKVCTAMSMAIAAIAVYDWPQDWPHLLPELLNLMGDQSNMTRVQGALRCLALLCGDLDDSVVPRLVPVLFPTLHTIVSSPQIYKKHLRAKALSIVYSCVSVLGTMSGVYETETSGLIKPMLKSWMGQFAIALGEPVPDEDPDDWSLRMEVLKCLNQFVQNFHNVIDEELLVVVGPLWQTCVSSLQVYVQLSIQGTEDFHEGHYDSDGTEKSLESFVIQLFEFLLTLVGSAKFKKVIVKNVKELVYYTIGFLQVTAQQMHSWLMDVNEFVANEDDLTYSCRVSGALLLEEIATSCGRKGIDAIIESAKARFSESQNERRVGSVDWWRMREATLFALCSVADHLFEDGDLEREIGKTGSLIEQLVTEDIGTGMQEFPFLHARIFVAVAKFSSVIRLELINNFLGAAVRALSLDLPPPVKVGACHAVSRLLPQASHTIILPHMTEMFKSLTELLSQASGETLHLILDTIRAAIVSGFKASTQLESAISPLILDLWMSNISDPFVSSEAIEVLQAIKDSPGCIHPLVSRILPFVVPVLNEPGHQPDGLVAGSLDLLSMLLKNVPVDVMKRIYDTCFNSVVRVILQSEDHAEMQNATECLALLVSGGRTELLDWGGDSGFTMRCLLDIASRLLDPELESSGSLFVGQYILQLILHLPHQMAPHIRDLAAALVRRMQSAEIAGLRSSLLLIFAKLVHMSVPRIERFIDMLMTIPANSYDNAFSYVMSEWTKQQGEIQGLYQIKVTTTALALLLSSMHPELGRINVQGYLIQTAPGIITRSKAKSTPEQWSSLPLPAKILSLLAEALIEIEEQVLDGDDEVDSDWEEVEEGMDRDILSATAAASSGRPGHDQLQAMARVADEEDDEDDLSGVGDPLNEVNLANYLADFLSDFSRSYRDLLNNLCQYLTPAHRDAIRRVVSR
ncbi:hypothetical protein MLD38_005507 [Melastoma candidum]|uniref:Uncharacterized protein n=1 Tax=Melastoma candidum TaxID=119954 RepID=A0ACB9RL26_9MYRT|nr:hypothetical protein MLD38_005507 [Melastoma candidum]